MELFTQPFTLFQKGGPVMYLLLLCSLIVVSIAVERFLYYKEMQPDLKDLVVKITPALERGEIASAITICGQAGGVAATVAANGMQGYRQGADCMQSVLEGEASLAAAKLRQNLNHLDTIVTIAPLLGLLGTIIGMIDSFNVMNIKGGQPMAITGGVGEALIATASGLCVATLAMLVYSYFTHRLDRMITDIEQICILLIRQVKRETNHEIA